MSKLTEKQRRFVEAYMGDAAANATEAARLAGYKGDDNTLRSIGSENLTKPNIQAAIEERIEEDPRVMSRERLTRWLSDVVEGKVLDAGDEAALRERLKAAEQLAKIMGLHVKKVEAKVDHGAQVKIYIPDNGRKRGD